MNLLIFMTILMTFSFAGTTTAPSSKSISFDGRRVPFEQTTEGKDYIKKHGSKPAVQDAFGYPVPLNPLKQNAYKYRKIPKKVIPKPVLKPGPKVLPKKFNPNVKTSFLKSILDFLIPSAMADDFDFDPQIPGLVNCRDSIPGPNDPELGYFKVYFQDIAENSGTGYDEQNFGYGRVDAVCEVLKYVATIIKLDQTPNLFPDIYFARNWPESYGLALGTASPYFGLYQSASGVDNGTLHRHIISRINPTPEIGDFDAIIHTNWAYPFSVDSPTQPQLNSGNYDFKTVMLHEVLHALGFASRLQSVVYETGVPYRHNLWDENLYSPSSSYFLLSQPLSPLLQAPVGAPSHWFVNNVSNYNGRKNYVNAPLDGARPLFTPNPYQIGSSLSHFDMSRLPQNSTDVYVMNPSLPNGVARLMHTHEKEVLCHLGYQVVGMAGCAQPTPVAMDDVGTITATTTCIDFASNDISYSGGTLTLESLQVLSPSANFLTMSPIIYYQSPGCVGTSYSSFSSSTPSIRSLRVATPTQSVSIVMMKYRVKDSVSNRISEPAFINFSRCTSAQDEYVCNGDFEMGGPIPGLHAFGSPNLPFWQKALGTPDLVTKNAPGSHNQLNLPFPATGGGLDMVDNGSFAARLAQHGLYTTVNDEKITTKLKAPLSIGQCYKISVDVGMTGINTNYGSTYNILGSFSSTNMALDWSSQAESNPIVEGAVHVLNQPINVSVGGALLWQNGLRYFSPSQAFEFLTIHAPRPYYISGKGEFYFDTMVDNVSVKKVASSFCSTNSISGVVYNDLNNNGVINIGENVVEDVRVALLNSQTGEVIDWTETDLNGVYKFYSLPASSYYYVALMDESIFQSISEPGMNNLLSTYQHVRSVSFANGGIVTGENFGIFLEGEVILPPGPDNIVCAQTPPATNFNTSDTTANNVPLYQCYAFVAPNGARECLYNYAAPGSASGSNTGCPTETADADCCGWYTACPAVTLTGTVTNASNGANGGVALTISGTGPYTYQWSNGQTTQNLTNVAPGTYTVTVKNANGCQTQKSFIVHTQMHVNVVKNEGCSQAQNTITSTVTGGAAPFTHRFHQVNGLPNIHVVSNAPATATYTNVAPGTYNVSVVDVNGQEVQGQTVTIAPYTAPNFYWSKENATATAFNNGKITVNVQGGVAPFSYIFTGSSPLTVNNQTATTYIRGSLSGSNTNLYNVQVKDARNCLSNQVTNIKVLRALNAATTRIVRQCSGSTVNARILITPPTGGHGPYTYAVNGSPLPPGQLFFTANANTTNQLTITDSSTAAAQVNTQTVSVTTIPAIHTVSVATVAATVGQSNGSATVTTTTNLGPYTYTFTPPGAAFSGVTTNTYTRSSMAAGSYSVSVQTSYGCVAPKTFTILSNSTSTTTPR